MLGMRGNRSLYRVVAMISILASARLSVHGQNPRHGSVPTVSRVYTTSWAMTLLYGPYQSSITEEWSPKRSENYPAAWPDSVAVYPLMDVPYIEEQRAKHLLVTWAVSQSADYTEYTCHNCGVLIGLAIFEEASDGWRLESSNLQLGEYGTFGKPPLIYLQPIGPKRFGVAMITRFGAQGGLTNTSRCGCLIAGTSCGLFRSKLC